MSWLLRGLGGICTRSQYHQRSGPNLSGRRARACQAKSKSVVGDPCVGAQYFALEEGPGAIRRRQTRVTTPDATSYIEATILIFPSASSLASTALRWRTC